MGRRPLLPNAENCSCTELNTAAKAAPTQSGFVRMTAIRKLLEGWNPQTVAAFYDVTRQTLRNWITSFNERGIDGLIDKPRTGAPRKKNIIILDNASWHKKKSLDWGQFIPVYLPPYSPDLNPIEKLWLIVKAEWFSDFYAKNRDQLIEPIDKALMWLMNRKDGNRKTCRIHA